MSKTPREPDLAVLESLLKGKTLLVYWYILQQPTHMVGVREVQRALRFSSPSIAVHHLEKLHDLGLVSKKGTGEYVLEEEVKVESSVSSRAWVVFLCQDISSIPFCFRPC